MRAQPIQLIGQFYTDDARPWAMQDVCNYLPAAAETEGTRTPTLCKTPPGLSPFVQLPSQGSEVPILPGPIRGLHNAEGRLFAVSTSMLWQITPQGVAIPRGTIGGASRVRMAHNQQTFGNELIVVNGSSGYLYNTQTQTFAAISDDGYPGAIDVVFIDGYFVQIEPARRFAFNSGLADGGSYNTLDRWTSEVSPDLLVGLGQTQNELILFSENTAEFFTNEGHAQQPFRSKRISMERGAASRYGQAHLDNTLFWLGNDGKFYVLEGYSPKRISTRPIEQAIRGLNWGQAFAFVWESEGHAVVYWTFPDGQTWGYDASQGRWHRRASYGLDRWRVSDTAFWEDQWIAGDFQAGRLWVVDWDYPWEYQTEFVSEVVAPVIHDNQARVLMPRLEVLMDTGQPEVEVREFPDQPDGPTIEGQADDGTAGFLYAPFAYTGTPGDSPIASFTVTSGTLPTGLTLSSAGVLSGTPTVEGAFTFTVRVTDVNGLYDELSDTVEIAVAMFLAVDNLTALHYSLVEGDDDFVDTVATGLPTTTSTVCVQSAAGNLFHFGAGDEGRVSSDMSATFDACTGLAATSGFNPGDGNLILVGTEFQLYHWGLHVANVSDPTDWAERVLSVPVQRPVARGSTVLGFSSSKDLAVSTDAGNTFTAYDEPSLNATEAVQRILDTGTTFLVFGRAVTTGDLRIGRSTTGLDGSWTFAAGPATALCHGVARNPDTGRILMILQTGDSWFSDDDGVTWEAGLAVPYGGAMSFPPLQTSNMIFSNGAFWFAAAQGAGVNRLYVTIDGETPWGWTYGNTSGNALNSLCELLP